MEPPNSQWAFEPHNKLRSLLQIAHSTKPKKLFDFEMFTFSPCYEEIQNKIK